MTCTHRMWEEPNGLRCMRSDIHDEAAPGGHIYESRDGSFTNRTETSSVV